MKKAENTRACAENLVSVIIPVYNSEQYLRRCVESVIGQSYKNIEAIIVNDGSIDKSGGICDEYETIDERVHVIHTSNDGPAAARNRGIEKSKGNFIIFVDSDDLLDKNAIDLLMEDYHRTKADMVVGDFTIVDYNASPEDGEFIFSSNKLLAKQDIIDYVRDYLKKPTGHSLFVYNWGKLFRASIIKNNNISFNTNLHVFEDILFNFEYLKFAISVSYVKKKMYSYMINDNPVSAGMRIYDNPVGYKLPLMSIGRFLKDNGIDDYRIEREVGNACISFTIRTMVRFFSPNGSVDFKQVHRLVSQMISDSEIRRNLRFYSPKKGDSRILPVLMKLKLVWPILFVCRYKAHKRNRTEKMKRC